MKPKTMKTKYIVSFAVFLILMMPLQADAFQSEVYRVVVENLTTAPNRYLNNVTEIEGIVDRHLDDRTSAGYFYLRDDFGDFLRVRVLETKPEVNTRVRIRGIFTRELPANITATFLQRYYLDSRNITSIRDPQVVPPVISEHLVMIDSEPSGAEVTIDGRSVGTTPIQQRLRDGTYSVKVGKNLYKDNDMTLRVQGGNISRTVTLERSNLFYGVIAGSGLVLILIIGIAFIKVSNGRDKKESLYTGRDDYLPEKTRPAPVIEDEPVFAPVTRTIEQTPSAFATQATVDNQTVKINVPKDHTIKVLDEYFEVLEGLSEVSKIYLYQQPRQMRSEYTFGRNSGTEYYHIQLKSPAVSRNQAKLIMMKDRCVLINYAQKISNPTRVNDVEMDENESVELNINDVITMGDVKLRFASKRA